MPRTKSLFIAGLSLSLAGCLSMPVAPLATRGAADITVTPGGRITLKHDAIHLEADTAKGYAVADAPADMAMTYVAQVPPVMVSGEMVQANDIAIRGTRAYIAYNVAGAKFGGAIQIVDISRPEAPAILQEMTFADLDVTSLFLDGERLIFGGAANPDKYPYRSYVGAIDANGATPDAIRQSLKGLHSYSATGIVQARGQLWVGVGAEGGGVETLDDRSFAPLTWREAADVRDVAQYRDGYAAIAGTADSPSKESRVLVLANGKEREIPLGMPIKDYTKATIEVLRDAFAVLALSDAGLEVVDLDAPAEPMFTMSNPSSDWKEAANSASAEGNLLFVANGEYGFRVLEIQDVVKPVKPFARMMGMHHMDGPVYGGARYSANHIAYRERHLFVASGLGGVNIYYLPPGGGTSPAAEPAAAAESSPSPSPSQGIAPGAEL